MNDRAWQNAVQQTLNVRLGNYRQLGGGDFAQSWRGEVIETEVKSTLNVGQFIFVKTHSNPPRHHFSTEARGLTLLREADALNVPGVLMVSDDPPCLALEWIEEGARGLSSEVALGEGLAKLHSATCTHFGRVDERSTGSLGLPNTPGDSWAQFYATQRLLPLANIAHDRQSLSTKTLKKLERVANRLDSWVASDVAPSLLHGDLWAGNRLVDHTGCNWLIDPACHGGHREFDLAMMRLFGGFGEQAFQVYNEQYPLADGWQERIQLHQLAPLVVHAIKFGRAYVDSVESALDRYV